MYGDDGDDDMMMMYSGSGGSGTVLLSLKSGLYNSYVPVIDSYDLCQMGVVGETLNGDGDSQQYATCPNPGSYRLQTYFYVPQLSREKDFHYTPDLQLSFADASTGTRLGCATTGVMAMHKQADRHAAMGLVALGIALFVFVGVFGVLLYLSYRRKKQIERYRESSLLSSSYIRTLPSGQMPPSGGGRQIIRQFGAGSRLRGIGPGLTTVPSAPSDDASSTDGGRRGNDGKDISNPLYNTSRVPTRPII